MSDGGSQNRVSDTQELEFPAGVSPWVLGTKSRFSRGAKTFNC